MLILIVSVYHELHPHRGRPRGGRGPECTDFDGSQRISRRGLDQWLVGEGGCTLAYPRSIPQRQSFKYNDRWFGKEKR